jgi:NDP-sugar pyrophosphorylase family protein
VLKKAVIPAAGLGTRLLSVIKEQPKEMLPVFAKPEIEAISSLAASPKQHSRVARIKLRPLFFQRALAS